MSDLIKSLDAIVRLLEGSQTAARQRVQPELLNMIAMKRQYDNEVAALKKANSQNKPKHKPDTSNTVVVYTVRLKRDDVLDWMENRSEQDAFENAKRWFTTKMPRDFKEDLPNHEEWRKAVIGVWDRAVDVLKNGADGQTLETANYARAVEMTVRRIGVDRGLDKHGNRIPPKNSY